MLVRLKTPFFYLTLLMAFLYFNQAFPCSRLLIAENQNIVMVGRNMDWYEEMDTALVFYPRNLERSGDEPLHKTDADWLSWTSRYASIVATGYEDLTTDGLNEMGFAAHILWLEDTDFGDPDTTKPWLSLTQWTQYYLDNFATVAEAVQYTLDHPFDVIPFYHETTGQWGKLHLALDDASGDSAILEYLEGRLQIQHSKNTIAVTNEPSYEEQLKNLKQYKHFGGLKPLPGLCNSEERFVRASYFAALLPQFLPSDELFTALLSILNNIAQPYSAGERTIWRTISDLTNKVYYFQSTSDQKLISLHFDMFIPNEAQKRI